jgi:hypothetical protein
MPFGEGFETLPLGAAVEVAADGGFVTVEEPQRGDDEARQP